VPVDKNKFSPDKSKLTEEFHQTKWLTFSGAKKVITDGNTLTAISAMETYN